MYECKIFPEVLDKKTFKLVITCSVWTIMFGGVCDQLLFLPNNIWSKGVDCYYM